jgi:small subunit ribosomal protein S1
VGLMADVSKTEGSPDNAGVESFAALFEQSLPSTQFNEGDIVRGRVIMVGKEYVVVDIGFKSEGQIPIGEFLGTDGDVHVKEGDDVEVLLESREDDEGLIVLSKEKADKLKVWDEISAACERDELIEGTITQRVKGGLSVTIRGGVKAFLPGSQVDLRPVRNLDSFISQTHKFKVIKFNKKRGNIVLSRRALLERERAELKEATLEKLAEGKVVEGVVKNLTEYGAFIDLGGIDGLLHITDMSWGRVNHPSELFQVGDKVQVKVLKYNPDTERVSLGLKQITEDPWTHAENQVCCWRACHRQSGQPERLRRLRRAGRGHRGPDPRVRDELDASGQAPFEGRLYRRHRRRRWCSTSMRKTTASAWA